MLRRFVFVLILMCLATSVAKAQSTLWVSDQLRISMRSGPGNNFEVVRILATGTPLQTKQTRGDWAEIRLEDGETGWVIARYLDAEKPAQLELPRVRDALDGAEARIEELESQLASLQSNLAEFEELRAHATELEARNAQLETSSATTMMTIGAGIALAGVLLGALWPRRSSSRGISLPRSYLRS